MKKSLFLLTIAFMLALSSCGEPDEPKNDPGDLIAVTEKPVIYLYPETSTEVNITLNLDGKLTCTYPAYNNGWNVTAEPDGRLFSDGKEYYCLYWEGVQDIEVDFSDGFCVKGKDTAEFLESSLAALGLNEREANEFIVYWLPRMEANPYNLISFRTDAYLEAAELEITPTPDSLIRVFMTYKPLNEAVEITQQKLVTPERNGFIAVEWGGREIS